MVSFLQLVAEKKTPFLVQTAARKIFSPSYFVTALKFIYSEKATTFCEISTIYLSYVVTVKFTLDISWPSQNIHSVAKVYAVLPFYDVKCLCSGGRE